MKTKTSVFVLLLSKWPEIVGGLAGKTIGWVCAGYLFHLGWRFA